MFKNRRRMLLGAFFTLMLLVVIGIFGLEVATQNSATVSGFSVAQPVAAGTVISSQDVRQVQVKQSSDFAIYQQSPVGTVATHSLSPGDLLRASDLTTTSQVSDVAIFLTASPVVAAGDLIDVYTSYNGRTILLATHIPVVGTGTTAGKGVSGTGVVVQVPIKDEAYWLTLGGGVWPLSATKVSSQVAPGQAEVSQDTSVLAHLSGLTQAQIDAAAGQPVPTPSPSASPSASATPAPNVLPTPGATPTP